MGKEVAKTAPDEAIARLAARQHGVVTTPQLTRAGLHPSGITKRISAGRLHRVHRSVYAVGHAGLSNEGKWMAGVLALGDGAVLSHRSAAVLWRVWPSAKKRGAYRVRVVEVTVPGRGGRARRPDLVVHRSSTLTGEHCTREGGIPVTSPQRTLEDLRRVLPRVEFAAALREAEFLRLPLRPQQALDHTRSELEARFLALCRRHRLPPPEVNVQVGPFVVDFLWRIPRLIVEVDGWEAHGSRSAFESDRARDVQLATMGFEVLRFTWDRITRDSAEVAAAIESLHQR
jgi:very-short-patch-repair endonuclease